MTHVRPEPAAATFEMEMRPAEPEFAAPAFSQREEIPVELGGQEQKNRFAGGDVRSVNVGRWLHNGKSGVRYVREQLFIPFQQ
ncbi:hypothetical protein [Amycolatopsis sp. CA-128772]|uniref:hypothetical protein n=1 Tax=Amycolatopsis sp. CA-128772 TaxID=2073159 RepID=UPI000CD0FFC5|nr:hypothetical protein [Amycolatopsis sp. CA-128772]